LLGAACLGAFMHGTAADELSKTHGFAGFSASEVAHMIPMVRKELEFAE
jgi:NAD(P)H-hydrate epimerase